MDELVGAWRLTAAEWIFDDGETIGLYGAEPHGRSVFSADGWMIVVITGTTAMPSGDAAATPFTLAYSGRYVAEAARFMVDVDVSSMPMWIGTKQERAYELDGDTHTILLGMPTHPAYPERPGQGKLRFTRE